MEKTTLRRADLVTSVILMIISTTGIALSIPMLLKTARENGQIYKSAGLFPLIICILLGLCAVNLFLHARKDGAKLDFFTIEKIKGLIKSREFKICFAIIGLTALYIFVLLPYISYGAATFVFLSAFMIYFKGLKNRKGIIISLAVSAIATFILTYGFGNLAMIPLP